jgi:hypothetical protein
VDPASECFLLTFQLLPGFNDSFGTIFSYIFCDGQCRVKLVWVRIGLLCLAELLNVSGTKFEVLLKVGMYRWCWRNKIE